MPIGGRLDTPVASLGPLYLGPLYLRGIEVGATKKSCCLGYRAPSFPLPIDLIPFFLVRMMIHSSSWFSHLELVLRFDLF
jgi:hypothetical protein